MVQVARKVFNVKLMTLMESHAMHLFASKTCYQNLLSLLRSYNLE
jgi:hypothetical protein